MLMSPQMLALTQYHNELSLKIEINRMFQERIITNSHYVFCILYPVSKQAKLEMDAEGDRKLRL